MPLTPAEMVPVFDSQAHLYATGAASATDKKDYDLVAFNLGSLLQALLMKGLLQWRYGFANPSEALNAACSVAIDGTEVLEQLRPGHEHWRSFNTSPSGFIGFLVHRRTDRVSKPSLDAWSSKEEPFRDYYLDAAIVNACETRKPHPLWPHLLEACSRSTRLQLLRDTYKTYMSLIEAPDRSTQLEAVTLSATLFANRRRSDYFSGGLLSEGGRLENKHVVDYRLGAIWHLVALSDTGIPKGTERHHWRW